MRYCLEPRCNQLVESGRCAKHARQADAGTRGTAAGRGYTSNWARYSKTYVVAHPVCGMQTDGSIDPTYSRCAQEGRTTRSEVTDHIIPVRHGGAFWNPQNHQALCRSCNTWKANVYERRGGIKSLTAPSQEPGCGVGRPCAANKSGG